MMIIGLLAGVGWLIAAVFLVQRLLRRFLGPLYSETQNSKRQMQFSLSDIYVLIVQIALVSLAIGLKEKRSDGERLGFISAATLYLGLSWLLCCRNLARANVQRFVPRLFAMIAYPIQVVIALVMGFGWLHLILLLLLSPIAGMAAALGCLWAYYFFEALSRWVYAQREKAPKRDSKSLTELAKDVQLPNAVVSKTPQDDTLPEK